MKRHTVAGFTIIETMLFLAVSGALAVGLMAGMGAAIGAQQYRDSVQSYADFLRTQHSQVITVVNNRSSEDQCSLSAPESQPRGRSSCVVVGRYITSTDTTGEKYTARPIFALQSGSGWTYAFGAEDTTYETHWSGTTRVNGQALNAANVHILMWRSPDNGVLRIASTPPLNAESQIASAMAGASSDVELCVRADSLSFGERLSVYLTANAGSSDAIRVATATGGCST